MIERMRACHWLGSELCFDTAGWVIRRVSGLQRLSSVSNVTREGRKPIMSIRYIVASNEGKFLQLTRSIPDLNPVTCICDILTI